MSAMEDKNIRDSIASLKKYLGAVLAGRLETSGDEAELEAHIRAMEAMLPRTKVVVIISGGNVQTIKADSPNVQLIVIDHDNLKAEGKSANEANKIVEKAVTDCPYNISFE